MDTLLQLIAEYRYWILFPLACFEGPITGFVVGTLVAFGSFDGVPAFGLLIMGDVLPDISYYFLGRYGEKGTLVKRALGSIGVSEEHFGVIRDLWHTHTGKTMFFSKLAYGLSTPFLISAGFTKLEFKKFLLYALPVTLAQYSILMGLGYYFGAAYYNTITQSFNGIGILIASMILVAAFYAFFTRFMRNKLLQTEQNAVQAEMPKV